jgi:hypothetical protein
MKVLKYTLIGDGSSDKTLLLIIKWLLDDLYPKLPNEAEFADFRSLPNPPKSLKEKVKTASNYYPSTILFIHRDAEKTDVKMVEKRILEVSNELTSEQMRTTICVVPVKMMESWLLFDVEAIKKAAGNRNSKSIINLPPLKNIEKETQPKELLYRLLKEASGLKGRNLKNFNENKAVHLVAENITDFSPLRELGAFQLFEEEVKQKVGAILTKNNLASL